MLIILIGTVSCVRLIQEVTDTTDQAKPIKVAVAPKIEIVEPVAKKVEPVVVAKKEVAIVIKGKVLFAFDSADLDAGSKQFLNKLTDEMKAAPDTSITLKGHTDKFGPDEYNQTLSERRADSVKDYIIGNGIDASRITSSEGFGESQLLPELSNYENRRVIIASIG